MNANQPLEDRWAADSLNQCTTTRSLCREPMIENEVKNNFLKEPGNGEDLEEVIAEQALSTLVPCTLPLKDLLRVKPGVWTRMSRKLYIPELRVEAKPPKNP